MSSMSQDGILALVSREYPWKDRFSCLDTIDSTNNRLKILAREGAPHGTALCANRQTGGRGRLGRNFLSPPGVGIYLSILFRPDCMPESLMHLTCAAAEAMCDALENAAGFRPGIKWTNDLVYNKRKLCGILTELGLTEDGKVDYAVVGIGVNCCQHPEDFPPELQNTAASIAMVTGKEPSRDRLAAAMLDALHRMDEDLLAGKEEIMARYRRDCVTIGQDISLLKGDTVRHGKALDVDSDGALIVEFSPGHREAVSSGEVSVRGMYGYL